ncbi:hypothetical protein FHT10_000526 [Xanthomonas arboricola]|nr:hypothetical protein [Xanthomonas cannabis]
MQYSGGDTDKTDLGTATLRRTGADISGFRAE